MGPVSPANFFMGRKSVTQFALKTTIAPAHSRLRCGLNLEPVVVIDLTHLLVPGVESGGSAR